MVSVRRSRLQSERPSSMHTASSPTPTPCATWSSAASASGRQQAL